MTLQARTDPEKMEKLKRQYDAWQDRIAVIHNPARKNAHDVEVLEQQNQTRAIKRELDKQEELAEAERMLAVNQYLDQRERNFIMAKKQREREDLAWSAQYCSVQNTREYDITHPDNSQPIRKDTIDANGNVIINPQIGVSSGQWFNGEDLGAYQRKLHQNAQFDQAFRDKMREEAERRAQEKQDQRDYDNKILAVNRYLDDQENQQKQQKLQENKDVQQFNLDQQENARRAREAFRQQELDEYNKATEEFNNTRLMTGEAAPMKSTKPIINSEHKGLTAEQKKQYEADQAQQRIDDRRRREENYQNKLREQHHELDIHRELTIRDRRQQEQRKELAMEIAEENRRNAINHITKKQVITHEIGKNDVYEDFHMKWEKSAR